MESCVLLFFTSGRLASVVSFVASLQRPTPYAMCSSFWVQEHNNCIKSAVSARMYTCLYRLEQQRIPLQSLLARISDSRRTTWQR